MLVVDDDFMVAKLHSRFVSATDGFRVVGVAHNGAEALRAAEKLRPDLVLLDIYLPDMDGLNVLRELRAAEERDPGRATVDALFITAARDAGLVRAALRAGALHYLIKPFTQSALQEQLRHVASLRSRFDRLGQARQEDVDQIFGTRPPGARGLPKGLAPHTAELVERILREHPGDLSASECAEAGSLSRVSARRYLEYFVETGRVEVTLRYGGTGRPERRYRIAGRRH
ncbi:MULTISPECIES: response regulator [Streptomyces]|uniref:Transcriptional regulatory protein n=1 Tax=Streptomyces tsukubensis (strain DSM 42081 / NBRC 108919 / NRRL 18488 / 9993) TaxID=1114943 RepID=I2MVW0_STRT9|nr:response regulator [Streptomyces tsukubensis]MYS65629.1 response regulator [Streptomyces sp. SID5473]AZK93363.1 response regulator [Streptomyces tsukubensis]EIF88907.1 two-component system response regulator [Streptomyces tsukubensis NRRL18488]QKM70480.1 response regulator [Streptomyces tsukubensis NRRL18488]TAI40596.1 response regulator [Streptomyces tsukubensis]